MKTLGNLTTALAAITTQIDHITNNRTPQVATLPVQYGTSAMVNRTATFSAVPDPGMDEQVWLQHHLW